MSVIEGTHVGVLIEIGRGNIEALKDENARYRQVVESWMTRFDVAQEVPASTTDGTDHVCEWQLIAESQDIRLKRYREALQKIASYSYAMGPAIDRISYLRDIASVALNQQ